MDQEESRELGQALDLFLDEALERILFSNPVDRERIARSRLRPLLIKGLSLIHIFQFKMWGQSGFLGL